MASVANALTANAAPLSSTPGVATILDSGGPLAKVGKLIGFPHTGTHTLGDWQSDNAVDIATPIGTPMVAVESGVVTKIRHHPPFVGRFAGDQITIKADSGQMYFYAHGAASVKVGQHVSAGQQIGTSGSANGVAHLHFAVMNGSPLTTLKKWLGGK
jgi:murein DD-endopeptidase MepM/ murein hydrolase activator NlpD